MKLSTLMLASLITLGSTAAFAEGGAERAKAHYDNFTFMQNQLHSTNERVAAADGKDMKMDTVEETNTDQQPKS